jgi:dihydroflavonol-4-reductase
MKVLITGATGFLGEWIVKRSVENGFDVHVLIRKSSNLDKIAHLPITKHIGDITDSNSLMTACKNMDAVFHLAGKIAYTKAEREDMQLINVEGTRNVLSACKVQNIKTLVYLSSVTAIGASFKPESMNEDSAYNIAHLHLGYFDTKHEAEKLVLAAYQEGWLEPVILNPSTIYGAGDATKSSRKVQMKVAQGKFPFYTPGGVNVVHIEDVVDGFFIALDKKVIGERIILANENMTIKSLFERIAKANHVNPPKILLPKFALHGLGLYGDFMQTIGKKGPMSSENAWTSTLYHWFDNTKAKTKLNMKFRSSNAAIEQSIYWAKQNGFI